VLLSWQEMVPSGTGWLPGIFVWQAKENGV